MSDGQRVSAGAPDRRRWLVRSLACSAAVEPAGPGSASLLPGLPVVPIKGAIALPGRPRRAAPGAVRAPALSGSPQDGLIGGGSHQRTGGRIRRWLTPRASSSWRPAHRPVPAAASVAADERWWGSSGQRPIRLPCLPPSDRGCGWPPANYRNVCCSPAVTARADHRQWRRSARMDARRAKADAAFLSAAKAAFVWPLPSRPAFAVSESAPGSTAPDLIGGRQSARRRARTRGRL